MFRMWSPSREVHLVGGVVVGKVGGGWGVVVVVGWSTKAVHLFVQLEQTVV